MKRTLLITSVTIVLSVVVTTLAIDAADTLTGKSGTLLSSVVSSGAGGCPTGMVPVAGVSFTCADSFEASPSSECPNRTTSNQFESRQNIEDPACTSVSAPDANPWVNVTREQARALCAQRDARLPTNAEWYQVALGMRDIQGACNTESGALAQTGTFDSCVTESGVHDMIGNVWEWTSDDVIEGVYNDRMLPESGYVAQVDQAGVAVVSSTTPEAMFYDDYVFTSQRGAFGMMRGGFYGSRSDAGVFAVHAQTLPTAPGAGIGFRCVQ